MSVCSWQVWTVGKDWLTLWGSSLKSVGQTGTPGSRNAESPSRKPWCCILGRLGEAHHAVIVCVTQSAEAFRAHRLGF